VVPESDVQTGTESLEYAPSPSSEEARLPQSTIAEIRPEMLVISETAEPCLNLRPQPGPWEHPLDCLWPGTRVERTNSIDGWSQVILEDGRAGWMATGFLTPLENPEGDEAPANDLLRQTNEAEEAQRRLEQELEALRLEMERARESSDPPSDG
jgi:hypothetical protein